MYFSIIVPIYNPPKEYLDVCIKSLLAQTLQDYEIILVDDGSNISCQQLCDTYAAMDCRIRVIHQENQGVSAARNHGVRMAKADWVMFIDADDWIEPHTCERLKKELETQNCDILMFNAVKEFENKTQTIHIADSAGIYNTADVSTRELLYRRAMKPKSATGVRNDPIYFCWDKVYKRSFLTENNLQFPVGLRKSEDKVFVLSCMEKVNLLCYIDDILYHYRMHTSSVCHKYSETADKDRIELAKILYDKANCMDKEMALLTGNADYNKITTDYYRFIFGVISNVLLLKYYHPDCPYSRSKRSAAAKAFIHTEPFKTAIHKCRYRELSSSAKLKKLLLSGGFVDVFIFLINQHKKRRGRAS